MCKAYLEKKNIPRKFHQELWIKEIKLLLNFTHTHTISHIRTLFHTYAHNCCAPKLLSQIQLHVLSIPCSAADSLGLVLGACHREFQLEKHNEVSHHCGTELQDRRQLHGEDTQDSRGNNKKHKERSSAGAHTFETSGCTGY
jgi:hypothetical protein